MNACRRLRLSGGIVPPAEEFRTVESISSDFNITKHQSTYRIMTSTLPYIDEVMRSFYNSGTGIPPRSPLERFKRRCTGHVTARRFGGSRYSCWFRQQIDGARGADADRCAVCPAAALHLGAVTCRMVIGGRLTSNRIASSRTTTPCHENPNPNKKTAADR